MTARFSRAYVGGTGRWFSCPAMRGIISPSVACATAPSSEGAKGMPVILRRTILAPFLGSCRRSRLRGCRWGILPLGEKTRQYTGLHCHSEERSDVGNPFSLSRKCIFVRCIGDADCEASLRTGFAMTGCFYADLSFPLCSSLSSGDPFGASCHCLAAARSRRGSDMPRHVIHYRAAASLP